MHYITAMASRFYILVAALTLLAIAPAAAEPRAYALEPETSKVSFTYTLLGNTKTGTMPIQAANLTLDFQRLQNSSAQVTLNAAGTRTGLIFVTETLKSPEVLSTDIHPRIIFKSTGVTQTTSGARVAGNVTLRGITRPLVLDAQIFRQKGTEAGDLSRLSVLLTGSINRSEFGASGYADTVDDQVDLRILARLRRVE